MITLYRILAALVPSPRREWIRAHEAELELIEGRGQRWRWTLGAFPLVGSVLVSQLRLDPRSFLGGTLMKTTVATLSTLNLAGGAGLAVLYVIDTSPPIVLALSVALLIQGGYTLALIAGVLDSHQDTALHLQLVGSTLALVIGAVGFLIGFLANLNPPTGDPEYGPMTIAALIAAHALISLLAFTPRRPVNLQTPTP